MKPKVLITPLCGPERSAWINPRLCASLLRAVKDPRFDTDVELIYGSHGIDTARNLAIDKARQKQVSWNVQIDNDMVCENLLSVLAEADTAERHVVAVAYGITAPSGNLEPSVVFTGKRHQNFMQVTAAGAGVLMISSKVWQALPVLFEGNHEDVHFCRIAQAAGFQIWTHASLAGHLHTVDLTAQLRGVLPQK